MIPYQQLNQNDKNSILKLPLYSGIYASGESHFYDSTNQTIVNDNFDNHTFTSILSPNGLIFDQSLSNAFSSRNYAITDFAVFNNYIHESAGPLISINTSNFLQQATTRFNIYSLQFRNTYIS